MLGSLFNLSIGSRFLEEKRFGGDCVLEKQNNATNVQMKLVHKRIVSFWYGFFFT